jgi:hypothetical protein
LSLCGAIEPTDRLVQYDFALRAAFDHYFPDLLRSTGAGTAGFHADAAFEEKIAAALHQTSRRGARCAIWGVGNLADVGAIICSTPTRLPSCSGARTAILSRTPT